MPTLIAAEWIWTVPFCHSVVNICPKLALAVRRVPGEILYRQLNEPSPDAFSCKLEVGCDWLHALDYDIKYVSAFRETQHACYIETLCGLLEVLASKSYHCLHATLCRAYGSYAQVEKPVSLKCLVPYRLSCEKVPDERVEEGVPHWCSTTLDSLQEFICTICIPLESPDISGVAAWLVIESNER